MASQNKPQVSFKSLIFEDPTNNQPQNNQKSGRSSSYINTQQPIYQQNIPIQQQFPVVVPQQQFIQVPYPQPPQQIPMAHSYFVEQQPPEQVVIQQPEIIREKIIHVERPNAQYEEIINRQSKQIESLQKSLNERNEVIEQQRIKIAQQEANYQQNLNNISIVRDLESRLNFMNRENLALVANKESLLAAIVQLEAKCAQISEEAYHHEKEKSSGHHKNNQLQLEIQKLTEINRQKESEIIQLRAKMGQLDGIDLRYKQQMDEITRLSQTLDFNERERQDLKLKLSLYQQHSIELDSARNEVTKLQKIVQQKDLENQRLIERISLLEINSTEKIRLEDDLRKLALALEQKDRENQQLRISISQYEEENKQYRLRRDENQNFNLIIIQKEKQIEELRADLSRLISENLKYKAENEKVYILAQELEKTNQILTACMNEKEHFRKQLELSKNNGYLIQEYEDRTKKLIEEIDSLQKRNLKTSLTGENRLINALRGFK